MKNTKEIYGIYDMGNSEQCVCVGELFDIYNVLGLPYICKINKNYLNIVNCINTGSLYKGKYEIMYLYEEEN